MNMIPVVSKPEINLNNCDREPIHIIGTSQAHGMLVSSLLDTFKITHCSENSIELIGIAAEDLLGKSLDKLVGSEWSSTLSEAVKGKESLSPAEITLNAKDFLMIPHISGNHIVLELEPSGGRVPSLLYQEQLGKILNELNSADNTTALFQKAVSLVKNLYEYDRVMLYRFDNDWNGEVIAEIKEAELESWLGLHYPATDIPKPARDLFLRQGVREISNVSEPPAQIRAVLTEKEPLDLSKAELRGVSPIHIEYLKNMGVAASLTAAVVVHGKLWGLITCHNYSPKFTGHYKRQSVKFLTQVFSNQLTLKTTEIYLEKIRFSDSIREKLVDQMIATDDIATALCDLDARFTQILESGGGALYINKELRLIGKTPSREEVVYLINHFLKNQETGIFYTKKLSAVFPEALPYKAIASGLLSCRLSENNEDYMLWFRPEEIQTVDWGGNPEKNSETRDGIEYLSPRKSFEKWTEVVSGMAVPWQEFDIKAAAALKENVLHAVVSNQKKQISALNARLTEINSDLKTFSYTVAHDLSGPLRGISGFAVILKNSYLQDLDERGKLAVETIARSSARMKELIKDLLSYSGLGNMTPERTTFSVEDLLEEILENLSVSSVYPNTSFKIAGNLPKAFADKKMTYQLLSNLLTNAIKYSVHAAHPEVEIGYRQGYYYIKDNGIGFDPRLQEKIFKVFARLVGDEYPGTGIGLATVKRILEKHSGEILVESFPGRGTTFYFRLGKDNPR